MVTAFLSFALQALGINRAGFMTYNGYYAETSLNGIIKREMFVCTSFVI